MTTTDTVAATELQAKRKKYGKYSGDKLKNKLTPKNDTMQCVKEDEIHLKETRMLKIVDYVVIDVTDAANPRVVPEDEVYLIGW